MDKKRRTRKLILIGSAIVILGVAGYFGYKWWKDKKGKDEKPPDDSIGGDTDLSSGGGGGGGGSITTSNPFKTSDELKKFQKWVIDVAKDSAILGASLDDGKWGKNSANAWTKYGERYQKETGTVVSSTSTTSKGSILGIVSKKQIRTSGGTPENPTDTIYYDAGKAIGLVAYKKADGSLTIVKTSDSQKPIVEKGKSAALSDFYYFKYYDTNTKTYRNIVIQGYEFKEGIDKLFKFVPKII